MFYVGGSLAIATVTALTIVEMGGGTGVTVGPDTVTQRSYGHLTVS